VIKVQRPDVERLVERDLDILRRLAGAAEESAAWARRIGSVALADGFAANLKEELDFRIEAQNMATIGAHNGSLRIPRVYPDLSTRHVLVEEWIEGQTLRHAHRGLDAPARKLLARSLLEGMLGQIFDSAAVPADPSFRRPPRRRVHHDHREPAHPHLLQRRDRPRRRDSAGAERDRCHHA
jgi:ubiquinone biosynthesis protein